MPCEHDLARDDRPEFDSDAARAEAAGLADRELRHELRNALAAAVGYASWLRQRADGWESERDRHALDVIQASLRRACRLLWPAIEQEKRPESREHPDLRGLVVVAVSQVPPQRFGDIVVRILTADPLAGDWDDEQITQVLINLLGNAVKYSPCGSPIVVELGRCGDRARVVVRDQGIGIAQQDRDAIFKGHRSQRAREVSEGSGIGLRLSRRLIEAHGGELGVVDQQDAGSAFWFELPLAR